MAYRTACAARVTALDAGAPVRERCHRLLVSSSVTTLTAFAIAALIGGAIELVATCLSFAPLNVDSVIRTNVPHAPWILAVAEPAPSVPGGAGIPGARGKFADATPAPDAAPPSPPTAAVTPQAPATPHVAKGGPPPIAAVPGKRQHVAEAESPPAALPEPGSRTAVYDISAHMVYLPNGEKLEAHSGLGRKIDDPHFVNVQNEGPTPPNVYSLTLREEIFHGVRALRLTPVGGGNMFGRDGILAHSYMLGPNGQSNGCVSFANYKAFLRAFLNGEVDRIVVVARLSSDPSRALQSRREDGARYAFYNNGRVTD
jgi:hypothetical protein